MATGEMTLGTRIRSQRNRRSGAFIAPSAPKVQPNGRPQGGRSFLSVDLVRLMAVMDATAWHTGL